MLVNLEAPVLVPHAAALGTSAGHKGETKYSYEVIFRSQHYAFADNACREYLFICEFFHVDAKQAAELFHQVMGKTCTTYLVSFFFSLSLPLLFLFKFNENDCIKWKR